MQVVPYEKLNVTTMTLVMALSSNINIDLAFHLLPITRVEITQLRESSKCRLPHCSTPGSILSMRFRGNIRGVIRNANSPFKNAVTIDISTQKKNISLKLSSQSIQMCGASSREDGVEAASHVINHLRRIQKILDRMQNNPDQTKKLITWLKDRTKGDPIETSQWEIKQANNLTLRICKPRGDFSVIKPNEETPKEFDEEISNFLISMTDDLLFHSDFCKKMDCLSKITTLIDGPLELKHVDEAMVNYNYSLGFKVERANLNRFIDGVNGFISRFNNAFTTSVTIELPYEPQEGTKIKRRKNKIPHHTFLVYRSGSVTQSGPGGTLMKDAYYLFMKTLSELLPYIRHNEGNESNEHISSGSNEECCPVNM